MQTPGSAAQLLDYRQDNASSTIVPRPAVLSSCGWTGLHFELHQQPAFGTAEHQHTMHVLACGLSGATQGERWLDGKPSPETRQVGDLAIIPAGIAHRCNWASPAEFMILALEPTVLQQVGQDWVKADRIELVPRYMNQQDGLLLALFSTLRAEAASAQIGSPLLIDSLKTTLAIHLLRHYCATRPKPWGNRQGLPTATLQQVTEYIQAHLHREVRLVELAAIANLSPYHFLRLFKQSTGLTPHQYLLQRRIDQAQWLLQHSALSIAAVAVAVGFCDQSHFSRYFKRQVGATPSQVRQG